MLRNGEPDPSDGLPGYGYGFKTILGDSDLSGEVHFEMPLELVTLLNFEAELFLEIPLEFGTLLNLRF